MSETSDIEQELKRFTKEPPRLTQEYVDSLRRLEPRQAFHIKNIVEQLAGNEIKSSYQEIDYEPLGKSGAWIETKAEGLIPDTVMKSPADIQRYVVRFFPDADSDPMEILRFKVDTDRGPHFAWRGVAMEAHRNAIITVKQRINLERLPEFSRKFLREKTIEIGKDLAPVIQREIKDYKLGG